jgi:dihydroneopterin aldolase
MTGRENGVSGEHYRVFIKELVLACSIGAYPEERLRRQRVRFNVDMQVRTPAAPLGDDLANVLSYDDIVGGIRSLIEIGHINLVETLAEQIAEMCLADARVSEVRVSVEKLDVEPAANSVGVEIERRRTSHPAIADLFPRVAAASPDGPRRRGNNGR